MNQVIKIKPPKGYRWVRVGERMLATDRLAYELSSNGADGAAVSIEWVSMGLVCKCESFQSYIRKVKA